MKLVLRRLPPIKGTVRMPFLAPDAAISLLALEKDTDGLVYTDMWRDPIDSLLAKRANRASQLPGYSGHNYGMSVDLDVISILNTKKIRYEDILHIMKKRGWFCKRRDGDSSLPGANHFNFLGDDSGRYLVKCTMDPITWDIPTELKILELYGSSYQLETKDVQELLTKLRIYHGPITGQRDAYTREAIMAFQRTWDLTETGFPDMALCRTIMFITSELELVQQPSWAV